MSMHEAQLATMSSFGLETIVPPPRLEPLGHGRLNMSKLGRFYATMHLPSCVI